MNGGSAPSLFDDQWVHGADLSSIRNNISEGIEDVGMPGFSGGFTDIQIEDVLLYIKSGEPDEHENTTESLVDISDTALIAAIDEVDNVQDQLHIEDFITGLDEPWGIQFAGDQVLITEDGYELLSHYPYEKELLI